MSDEKFLHKKSLGQHFLNSEVVPGWMADAGEVSEGDVVLEIGPGTGALTRELLARGAEVKAIETDERAIAALEETFASEIASGQLVVSLGDMRELSAADVAKRFGLTNRQFKLIANIPYYLSGFLFRTFLESPLQPASIIFLVQKEVAARIARDEKESLLSLSVKVFGTPIYIRTVKRGHFTPPPQIDSAIIKVEGIRQPDLTIAQKTLFFDLIHLGFGQKRKQLLGNLSARFQKTDLTLAFTELTIPLTTRAEDLALPTWLALVHRLSTVST